MGALECADPWGAVYCWMLNSYAKRKAAGLLVNDDGTVPAPVPVADTP